MRILSKVHREQERASREWLTTFLAAVQEGLQEGAAPWQGTPEQAQTTRELNGAIRNALQIPSVLRNRCTSTIDLMTAGGIDDFQETGNQLRQSFAQGLLILDGVRQLAEKFQASGYLLGNASKLEQAGAEMRQLQQETLENWPAFTQQDLDDARQAETAGRCVLVDEAFAQIAGVALDTWLDRVRQHQS